VTVRRRRHNRWSCAFWGATLVITALTLPVSAEDRLPASGYDRGGLELLTPGAVPGQLLSSPAKLHSYPTLAALAQTAARIRYRSTSGIDGSATVVSGLIFVPKANPPPQGWPIASIAHPTTGIARECAPSAHRDLMGNLSTVAEFLSRGYVVVASDYQGLGTPQPHPYLEPKTAAYNIIDAVRAARQAVPGASDTWVAYGFSQGGQAAWAASEMSADYGKGLRMVSAVSISPPTDLRPLVDAMENGTLTTDQMVFLPLILEGVKAAHPELNLGDYLHGVLADRVDVFFACAGVHDDLKAAIAKSASPDDVRPVSKQAADNLRSWLSDYSIPMRQMNVPMLVIYGDADPIIRADWTADAIHHACALGDILEVHVAHGQGHVVEVGDLPIDWTQARMNGTHPHDSCQADVPSRKGQS
jgi:pimeloyl-ACP methyl ester carboxylesterase